MEHAPRPVSQQCHADISTRRRRGSGQLVGSSRATANRTSTECFASPSSTIGAGRITGLVRRQHHESTRYPDPAVPKRRPQPEGIEAASQRIERF
jgi:hypothetical protein